MTPKYKQSLRLAAMLCLTILLLVGCHHKTLLDDTHTFQNNTWIRFQPEHYSVEASNTESYYNIIATVVIDTARYHENALPTKMSIASPDGETRTCFSDIVLRNYNGNWMGEFDEQGYLVCSATLREYYSFNSTGTHTIDLEQRTSKYEIRGIQSVNLTIKEVSLDIPE